MTRLHDPAKRGFASDNYAGVLPEVLEAIAEANLGHQGAYGADVYTAALDARIVELFGDGARAFPVFNGTGANVVALSAVSDRWSAVVCADTGHIHVDEGGAPEKLAGLKLFVVPTVEGKLTPEAITAAVPDRAGDVHWAQPRVLSVAQSTELGTVYTPDELRALAEYAHERDWLLHIDGSRLANAAASLGTDLRAITTDIGADVVSMGGTKNGLLGAELVVVLDAASAPGVEYVRKLSMQLASKQRFLAAQFLALLDDDRYLRVAGHANAMARLLADLVRGIGGVTITQPVQSNAVFAELPRAAAEALMERVPFYFWDEIRGEVRWMCAWDTTEEDVRAFAALISAELSRTAGI
ncbi:threonine aldolase [Tsukamurella tyrosinosolvens]|uniref:L-threonine aldolase n=2 Tax=Tsukamurella tyrosinosolvens TaxID=57704 RepID=A0A1H4KYK0_TSUTY|nr:aminotransferase class I/II-fold pyridoxal phosphate-dependent enzyme [Tsukamurella tyrosinosolvens]AUN38715.1 threonine aldolase [Tsukamurella tyrosinosolvens]KXO96434.1 threonine aldolase [Tsukamurella tyrosinosolvens]KXP01205.1 threonine aldolase [Tsukamurella tyrosinosolvens]KZL94572.1 threonine aldolase [Tsukamurella tyrosinosolvens]MCA4997385.1 threonine aldolase [Tsukamurella tyrosinosolvens]